MKIKDLEALLGRKLNESDVHSLAQRFRLAMEAVRAQKNAPALPKAGEDMLAELGALPDYLNTHAPGRTEEIVAAYQGQVAAAAGGGRIIRTGAGKPAVAAPKGKRPLPQPKSAKGHLEALRAPPGAVAAQDDGKPQPKSAAQRLVELTGPTPEAPAKGARSPAAVSASALARGAKDRLADIRNG